MDILSYLLGKQSAGGGGGTSFGTAAHVAVCSMTDGVPDPSTIVPYSFAALSGGTRLVSSEETRISAFAAGLYVELYFSEGAVTSDPSIALYDFDTNQGTLTEIPNALTVNNLDGYVPSIFFTMPDLVDGQTHTAIIGIPGSN